MDEDFPDLPDDDNLAFMKLEAEFRSEYQSATEDQSGNWEFEAADYMNKTLAAAKALNVEGPCCTNRLGDSLHESSMIAGRHEQLGPYEVQDHELVGLQ